MAQPKTTAGRDLKIGDTVDLIGGRDSIVRIAPYLGALDFGPGGARIATFARGRQMTIPAGQGFDVIQAEAA